MSRVQQRRSPITASIANAEELQHSSILGLGVYRPERVVTNDEICRQIDSTIGCVIVATSTYPCQTPAAGPQIAHRLGSWDARSTCPPGARASASPWLSPPMPSAAAPPAMYSLSVSSVPANSSTSQTSRRHSSSPTARVLSWSVLHHRQESDRWNEARTARSPTSSRRNCPGRSFVTTPRGHTRG